MRTLPIVFLLSIFMFVAVGDVGLAQEDVTEPEKEQVYECLGSDNIDKDSKEAEMEKELDEKYLGRDCYILRTGEESDDAQDLQNIDLPPQDLNTAVQELQSGLQLLQQLQSVINPGQTDGGAYQPNPDNDSLTPSENLFPSGQAPSTYFQGNTDTDSAHSQDDSGITNTENAETINRTSQKNGQTIANENLDWSQAQQEPKTSDSPQKPNFIQTDDSKSPSFFDIFKKPDASTGASTVLSPNILTNLSSGLASVVGLSGATQQASTLDEIASSGLNPVSSGIFSPVQNIINGASNGTISVFTRFKSWLKEMVT